MEVQVSVLFSRLTDFVGFQCGEPVVLYGNLLLDIGLCVCTKPTEDEMAGLRPQQDPPSGFTHNGILATG